MIRTLLVVLLCVAVAVAQQVGTQQAENHPSLPIQHCTNSSGRVSCTSVSASIVLDSNWRWTHLTTSTTNCYTGNTWDTSICTDPVTCAQKCAIDGADYPGTYGITTSGNSLSLGFVTHGPYSTNIGSRVYLMASDSSYYMFKLKNQEFTFDVDVSQLPCGLNGALYFVPMDADGGMSKYPNNKAGAKYGTGYCDAQCPHDIKFINGEANILNWTPSKNDTNAGTGMYGSCCIEFDVWEANSISNAITPHSCTVQGQYRCSGTQCGDSPQNRYGGVCDKDGCDFNPYRMGVHGAFGPGKTVDTNKPFTVVTQLITTDGTANGQLKEVRRLYVQNGKVINEVNANFTGLTQYNSITDPFCNAQKTTFGDKNSFESMGGLAAVGTSFGSNGMALVMSLWDDHAAYMLWLDSCYPVNGNQATPGICRGTCSTSSGVPSDVESQHPNAKVIFSNIKYGDLGSTYSH